MQASLHVEHTSVGPDEELERQRSSLQLVLEGKILNYHGRVFVERHERMDGRVHGARGDRLAMAQSVATRGHVPGRVSDHRRVWDGRDHLGPYTVRSYPFAIVIV